MSTLYIITIVAILSFTSTVLAQTTTTQLQNGQIVTNSVSAGGYNYYYFSIPPTNQVFGKRAIPNIYLSSTTCTQPQPPATSQEVVPSPDIYISTSRDNTLPGPNKGIAVDDALHGLSTWKSDGTVSEIWIAVGAASIPNTWTGNWTYEIGVSTSQILHPVFSREMNDTIYLTMDDTDRTNALFTSNPFSGTPPNATILMTSVLPNELSHSLCAVRLHTVPNYSVNTTTTLRGFPNQTKYQFMVSNLTQDTSYSAYMIQTSGSVVGITTPLMLSTKVDANCRIIYDLSFCDQVAYSVPTNPETFATDSMRDIANQYDIQAKQKFDPFGTALSQFNCETTQYSLVRNCTDCYRDYKTWLCAVSIPRCTDSSVSGDLSQNTDDVPTAPAIRDISVGASRNPWVDETIKPGEWTELLPCIDLCYHVVQSCPPFLQFFCPDSNLATVQYGYWQTGSATINGSVYHFDINNPTCNRMGVDSKMLTLSAASHLHITSFAILASFIALFLTTIVI